MTEQDIQRILARCDKFRLSGYMWDRFAQFAVVDLPAAMAEIHRLRAKLEEATDQWKAWEHRCLTAESVASDLTQKLAEVEGELEKRRQWAESVRDCHLSHFQASSCCCGQYVERLASAKPLPSTPTERPENE